jgi:hypothetical protein
MYNAAPPWRSGTATTVTSKLLPLQHSSADLRTGCASDGMSSSVRLHILDNSAYIPVMARRTFGQVPPPPTYHPQPYQSQQAPAPAMAPATASPVKKKIDWPPAVRQYVQRCFTPESMIKGITKEEMESKLKKVITDAAESGNLNNVNWAELPLPQQMIQEERNQTILAPPPPLNSWPPPVPNVTHEQFSSPAKEPLRKRKSSELATDFDEETNRPPWRNGYSRNVLEDRVSFPPLPDKRQRLDHTGKNASKSHANLESRKKRFEDAHSGVASPVNGHSSRDDSPAVVEDSGPIVGRSEKLEKNYFRLTSAPNPDTVRPLDVLKKTLEHLKKKWRDESNYVYICDQFKSLRQDLTVQHIKNDFTVNVYEIHARISLEQGDLGEYSQCQTQLRALYNQNLGGHPTEFKAYRILYFIHTCNRTDMNDVLSELTTADKAERAIKHALDVRSALALGNYHRFFQLYLDTPNMGAYLMDMFVARERLAALAAVCKVYVHNSTY